ncbi:MAG: hybrid sensor histidine kinase/response regulator [Bacteroidales bacterium]|nr:MAG: hybrid sensor histidine kinase/response regulator [Bacteroidales bacterium]
MTSNSISPPPSNTILIVDDNPRNLQVLGKLLQENNYEIEFATNGVAALEWLNIRRFDLIFLDINMSDLNGFEVCKIIRSNQALHDLPIIFLSAETERDNILKGFELGAQDYVIKPFDKRELIARVRTHIALKESREQLSNLNLSLEEKVKERTHQLKEAFDKLEAANLKLKELDKAKTDFLKMISYQIRTPLTGIVGPIQLLKEFKESKEIVKVIEILDESVKRLEKFSLNTLLITQLKTEGENIPKETILISDLINESLNDDKIAEQILNINIQVLVSITPPELNYHGNLRLLKTAIINVLDNAIAFSKPDGIIKINIAKNDHFVIFEIIDQGEGFQGKSIKIINELLSSNELPITPNLGLGLNLVKLIMDLHYGKVEVKNNKDVGACVSMYFGHS